MLFKAIAKRKTRRAASIVLLFDLSERLGQLVWARGGFGAAAGAFEAGDQFVDLPSFGQGSGALGVPGASALEMDGGHDIPVIMDFDLTGADAFGGVNEGLLHHLLTISP